MKNSVKGRKYVVPIVHQLEISIINIHEVLITNSTQYLPKFLTNRKDAKT